MKKIFALLSLMLFVASMSYASSYSISNKGKEFIKSIEKCKLTAYYDADGYSIGYGHHTKDVYKGQTISMSTANKYFEQDIKEAERMANYLLKSLPYKYNFSQGFIDGFISLIYNAGVGNVQKSAFYNRLKRCRVSHGKMNSADFDYTVAAVKTCCVSCSGHKDRRTQEYKMMSR